MGAATKSMLINRLTAYAVKLGVDLRDKDLNQGPDLQTVHEAIIDAIDELQTTRDELREKQETRESSTLFVRTRLARLEDALGCALGPNATANVEERFHFLEERGRKLRDWARPTVEQRELFASLLNQPHPSDETALRDWVDERLDEVGYWGRYDDNDWDAVDTIVGIVLADRQRRPESAQEPTDAPTVLRLPEEPPVGTTVELRGLPIGESQRWTRKRDDEGDFGTEDYWEREDGAGQRTWTGLWSLLLIGTQTDHQSAQERHMVIVPAEPLEAGTIAYYDDRARVEGLPNGSIVRANQGQGNVAVRNRTPAHETFAPVNNWTTAGSDRRFNELPVVFYPVKVLVVGEP